MDRVRFGRALGFGTRQAIKTVVKAVDAAAAPNPRAASVSRAGSSPRSATATPQASAAAATGAARPAAKAATQTRELRQGISRGGRRFGEAFWRPAVRLSGVLWLELAGVFFALFALFALGAVLKLHSAWRLTATNAGQHRSFVAALAMLAVFGYFSASSFLRARRRERQR